MVILTFVIMVDPFSLETNMLAHKSDPSKKAQTYKS